MQVALLGPLELSIDDRPVAVSGARLRSLLLRLAADAGQLVPGSQLLDAVWGEDRPADEANALQTLVSRLRRLLAEPAAVQQLGSGYRLVGVRTDLELFRSAADHARVSAAAGDLAGAVELYRQALDCWRGPALADAAEADWAQLPAARWQDEQLAVLTARIDCQLQLGQAGQVIGELTELTRRYPLQERFSQALMAALAAAGRPADGIAVYHTLRQVLADELGVDPSAESRQSYQALLRATDAEAEPVRPAARTNLRAALTSFLGRDDELKRLSTLLEQGRLATVVGPGGAGKTRLAGVVASQWLGRLPDGAWLVELAPVTDPANVEQAILSALGIWADQLLDRVSDLTGKSPIERLVDVLVDAECLLVIDNCEHLIAAAAEVIDRLLGSCPQLRVLATSREPLGIDGEALCLIAPLALPEPDLGPAEALSYPSVQLFADRASAVSANFGIDQATVASVVQIVRRLDGLPLAIELAAARLRVLPVDEIAARLSDRFRLLTGGSRIAMPRHRALRAVVEWSWDLLTGPERLLAERLAIFPPGATVASAEAICSDESLPAEAVIELLSSLVDKSLLNVGPDPATGGVRYQMLETIREYGIERLAERGELAELRLAHARYFGRFAADHVAGLRGRDQLEHLRLMQAERENVLSGLAYLAESAAGIEALQVAYSLAWYWVTLGRHNEAARWLKQVLDATAGQPSGQRLVVEAMYELNSVAATFGASEQDEAVSSFARMDELFDQLGDFDAGQDPLLPLLRAILTFFAGSPDRSLAALEPAMKSTDRWVRATALMFCANVHENYGDLPSMKREGERALRLFTELGDRWGMASTGAMLAKLKVFDADLTGAIESYQQAAHYLGEFGAMSDESMLHLQLAELYLRIGDVPAARAELARTKNSDFQLGSRARRLMTDTTEASIALLQNDIDQVALIRRRLHAEVEQLSTSPVNGHVMAIALAKLAELLVAGGELDQAERRLVQAYRYGLAVQDMPIMGQVTIAVARWAFAIGRPTSAAQIFGATAQLRGTLDPTDPIGQRLRQDLIAELGEDRYQQEFGTGRALDRPAALARADPASVTAELAGEGG